MPDAATPAPAPTAGLVLITGISGSGKSVALRALEDAGFNCIDNLPPPLLAAALALEDGRPGGGRRLAIAIDGRAAGALPALQPALAGLRATGRPAQVLFLDAATEALLRRYAETRRRHPLAPPGEARALVEAIEAERELLAPLREGAAVIDTSRLSASSLRERIRHWVEAPQGGLSLAFESFAYKQGVPLDADLVFDVRVLANPHYEPGLRPLSGRDAPVAAFLAARPEVAEMLDGIDAFLARWLPVYAQDQRASLTVALGCTGGQHRSVYCAEALAARWTPRIGQDGLAAVLGRHRDLPRP